MAFPTPALIVLALVSYYAGLFFFSHKAPKGLRFPPGPMGFPLIGSVFQYPRVHPWRVFADWSKIYGMFLLYKSPLHVTRLICRPNLQRHCPRQTNLHLKLWKSSNRPAGIALSSLLGQTKPIETGSTWRTKSHLPNSVRGPLLQTSKAAPACRVEPKSIQELSFDTDGGDHGPAE